VSSGVGGKMRVVMARSLLLVIFMGGVCSQFYPDYDLPELGPSSAQVTGLSSVVAPNAEWPYLSDHHYYPPHQHHQPSYYPRPHSHQRYLYNQHFGHGRRRNYGGRYGGYGGHYGGGYPSYYRQPYYYPSHRGYGRHSQALPNYINFANQLALAHNDPEGPYLGTHYKRAGRKRRSVPGYSRHGGYYGRRYPYYNPYYYGGYRHSHGRGSHYHSAYNPYAYDMQSANGLDDPMLTASFPSDYYGYTMYKMPSLRLPNPFGYNSPGLSLSPYHQYSRLGYSNYMSQMGRDGGAAVKFGFPFALPVIDPAEAGDTPTDPAEGG